MKLFIANICLLFVVLFTFSNCEDQGTESPILVFLTPEKTVLEADANDFVFITVEGSTKVGTSLSLHIETVDDLYGKVDLFDSTFQTRSFNYLYEYVVPQYPDSTESLMIFTLSNEAGDQAQIAKRLIINKGESGVTEFSGNSLFSSASDKPNAFSFETATQGYLADSLSFSPDIFDDTTSVSETLSRRWLSYTGVSFVKFNGFNYAAANSSTIQSAYESGVKLSRATDINDSDVFIVGRGSKALGVIQVIAVIDQVGVVDDKYSFSFKRIN